MATLATLAIAENFRVVVRGFVDKFTSDDVTIGQLLAIMMNVIEGFSKTNKSVQAVRPAVEYSVAAQGGQAVAGSESASTVPAAPTPAAHWAQAEVETAEYSPAKQAVQVEPPGSARVSVTLPAAQAAQAEVETAEYSPAKQAMQVEPPGPARVSCKCKRPLLSRAEDNMLRPC